MFSKKFKKKTNKSAKSDTIENRESVTTTKETYKTKQAQPIASMFAGLYCQYTFDYDNTYTKWLIDDEQTVCGPVIELQSHTPKMHLNLRDAEEIMKDVSIPNDFIPPTKIAAPEETEEEITIL